MDSFKQQKFALAYFFVAPALVYGLFTSRLPALEQIAKINETQVGWILLCLGCATLCGLFVASILIDKYGAKIITAYAVLLVFTGIIIAAWGSGFWQVAIFCLLTGFGVGFCDVGMNAMGIILEQRSKKPCMAFLHAFSSVGGVVGSLAGSFFAWLGLVPFFNLLIVLGAFALLWPWAYKIIPNQPAVLEERTPESGWTKLPFFVFGCGIASLFVHVVEGSAAEWGSLFLVSVKGAPQQEAALVFACFTGAMLVCRFCSDKLRCHVSDFIIVLGGSLLGAGGMILALLSPWPALSLAGYALMGAGLAPVVPILFSLAGATRGVTPGQASSVVSIFSYSGLLFFPPLLGLISKNIGLATTLWLIVIICLVVSVWSFLLLGKRSCSEQKSPS